MREGLRMFTDTSFLQNDEMQLKLEKTQNYY